MTRIEIINALAPIVSAASGQDCGLGQPRDIPSGNDTWIELELKSAYDLGESGGSSDETLTVPVVTITTIVGDPNGRINTLTAIDARATAIQAAIEADVTLGGIVQQARVAKVEIQPVQAADNAWASGARIEIEVQQW